MTFFMSLSLLFVASVILDNNLSVAETGRVSLHRYRRAACDPKYSEINPQHSMCLDDVGTPVTLTQAEKQSIVDMHNNLRELQDLPQATNMQKIVWDEDIAKVASKWVNQCGSGATAHEDSSDKREVPSLPGVHIGQNAANGYATFEDAVQGWYDEVKDFSYGQTMEIGLIGHFTQIVNANVARIGCGKAMCNGTPHYVCDYAKAQMFDELSKPYETGSIAAQCPNNVDSSGKLCDCGGKICLNGGTIDLATCTCACLTLYKGSDCSELNCPANDGQFCNNGYEKAHCGIYSNVPTECPYMCDICQAGSSCNLNCQNGGILDSVNCRCTCVGDYSGDQCETDLCSTRDHPWCTYINIGQPSTCNDGLKRFCPTKCGLCGEQQGCAITACPTGEYFHREKCTCIPLKVSCEQDDNAVCEIFFRGGLFPIEFCFGEMGSSVCPKSCGFCGAPACTKICKNGGKLNFNECSCECPLPYVGIECQTDMCSRPAVMACGSLTANLSPSACPEFLQPKCPHHCGICPAPCSGTICLPGEMLIETDCSCKNMAADCSTGDHILCQFYVTHSDVTQQCLDLPSGIICATKCGYCG
ncbi:multiple epidermal growth factor-like domains protein 10 isoform X3 [Patella vulgata]|uniref:multiple epidermal growth factor-like domains protein 10 isoform X3 n=1 Tax=Patella vulgata TaxID=6465 RepID=UPI00217F68DA|nr:multiple epidermal growth factor-like domains protein 10 isoform X3 [Patella vulgata]